MKKLVVVALAFFTLSGFAQQMTKEERREVMKERISKKTEKSPEQKAEINTKQLALSLDLTKDQQDKVESTLLAHFKEAEAKRTDKKDMTDDERHNMRTEHLDSQIALKQKMKTVLNDEQYKKYSQMMERRMPKGKRGGKRKK